MDTLTCLMVDPDHDKLKEKPLIQGICIYDKCSASQRIFCLICQRKYHSKCQHEYLMKEEIIQVLQDRKQTLLRSEQSQILTMTRSIKSLFNKQVDQLEQLLVVHSQNIINDYLQRINKILESSFSAATWNESYNLIKNQIYLPKIKNEEQIGKVLENMHILLKQLSESTNVEESITGLRDEQEISERIPVSVQQAEKLKLQALEFQRLMSRFNQTFISEDVNTYFVLSLKWLNSWKKHVSYNELINKQNPGPHFGRVSIQHINSDLIDNHVEQCFKYSPLKDHYWNVWMKETLQENIDYIVVNRDIWTFFAGIYQSIPIPRTATGTGANKYVAVKLLRVSISIFKFQAVLLYPNIINKISSGSYLENTFDKEYLQVDRNYEVAEYIALIQRTVPTFRGDYARDNGVRLWKYSTTSDDPQKTLFTEIKKQVQDLDYNDDHVFDFNGDLIDPTKYTTIEDVGIQANDLIIVEFKYNTQPWCVKNPAVQPKSCNPLK